MLGSVSNFFQTKGGDTWVEFVYMLSQIRANIFRKRSQNNNSKGEMDEGKSSSNTVKKCGWISGSLNGTEKLK